MISEFILLVSLLIPSGSLSANDSISGPRAIDPSMVQLIYGDTTSFSGAVSISPGTTYGSVFSTRFDVDYYSFNCSTSEIYFFSVADGLNVFVKVYGGANGSYTLYKSYTSNSNENNFGRNHGFYLDGAAYTDYYFVISSAVSVTNKAYLFALDALDPLNNGSFEVLKYDVASGFYTHFVYSPITAPSYTLGYVPQGITNSLLPTSLVDGTQLPLDPNSGYNTLTTYPYSAVARSYVSGSIGTAFMIGNNVLATAGHCALDGNHVPTSFGSNTYRFGANASGSEITSGNPAIIYVSPQYAKSNASYPSMYDWALVILDSNCGIDAGYLSIDGPTINSQLGAGDMLIIDGYRGGAQYQTLSYGEFQSYNTSYTITYSPVTQGGQSGSPVFSQEDGRVVGIHTGTGIGTRFFPELFSLSCELISGATI